MFRWKKMKMEVLRLRKKPLEEEIKRKFVTVKTGKKNVSRSLRRELLKNYGFKLVDN